MSSAKGTFIPGRTGETDGLVVSNARRLRKQPNPDRVVGGVWAPGEWGIRFGTVAYPDYATPHPTAWNGTHGGQFLTPEEADELAEHLRRAAAWARAQNIVQEPGS